MASSSLYTINISSLLCGDESLLIRRSGAALLLTHIQAVMREDLSRKGPRHLFRLVVTPKTWVKVCQMAKACVPFPVRKLSMNLMVP